MSNIIIKDPRGREIIRIGDNCKIAIARYPDMNEKIKKYVTDVFVDLTQKDPVSVRNFLDYKSEENEFCV